MGNFFQLLPISKGKDSAKSDFESFLDQRNKVEDTQEERESAKSRKKPQEAAAISAQPVETSEIQRPEKLETESKPSSRSTTSEPTSSLPSDSSSTETTSKPTAETTKQPAEESDEIPIQTGNSAPEDQIEAIAISPEQDAGEQEISTEPTAEITEAPPSDTMNSENQSEKKAKDPELATNDADGMESAPSDPEMISLETFDGIEASGSVSRETSITSIHRLTAFAAPERTGLAPIGAADSSPDSGLGQLAGGSGAQFESRTNSASSPTAQAGAIFKALGPELEKFRQTGRNQVQIDIPVGDNESVRIRLSLRAGELRSTFITESPELREALQKAWPEFAQTSRDRGMRLGDPTFQQGSQGNDSSFGQNTRRDRNSADAGSFPLQVSNISRKSPSARPASTQSSTALWA
jgi:hypothetical protein